MNKIVTLLLVLSLGGCMVYSEEDVRQMKTIGGWINLCGWYVSGTETLQNAARNELLNRNFSESDKALIRRWVKNPRVGMSEKMLTCLKGKAQTINTTTTANGVRKQHVYRYRYNTLYVYTQNGKVTAIQN